jgi:hypothetical protein
MDKSVDKKPRTIGPPVRRTITNFFLEIDAFVRVVCGKFFGYETFA